VRARRRRGTVRVEVTAVDETRLDRLLLTVDRGRLQLLASKTARRKISRTVRLHPGRRRLIAVALDASSNPSKVRRLVLRVGRAARS